MRKTIFQIHHCVISYLINNEPKAILNEVIDVCHFILIVPNIFKIHQSQEKFKHYDIVYYNVNRWFLILNINCYQNYDNDQSKPLDSKCPLCLNAPVSFSKKSENLTLEIDDGYKACVDSNSY